MITPWFKITQDGQFLHVVVRAPYTNVKETDIEYYDKTFLFSSKPYFLRLFLPCPVVDDESGTADYDADGGQFTIKVPKQNRGEFFPNLDMLSELIKPQQRIGAERLVEEVAENAGDGGAAEEAEVHDDELYASQSLSSEIAAVQERSSTQCGYGFAWLRHGVLGKFAGEIKGLIDIEKPDEMRVEERAEVTKELDTRSFDVEHYLADLFNPDDGLQAALQFRLEEKHLSLTDADREQLKDLRVRKLEPLDSEATRAVALFLVDVLHAYFYDLRTTDGEHTVESSWTIAKLAPSLSCLVRWTSAEEALLAATRRSLVYPLYRNWDLTRAVVQDVGAALRKGRSAILHCLLDIRHIMNTGGEFRYLFSQLYFDDYCLWIQSVDDGIIHRLRDDYDAAAQAIGKASMGLDLEVLETEAKMRLLEVKEGREAEAAVSEALDSDDEQT